MALRSTEQAIDVTENLARFVRAWQAENRG
jgi:hypothetical protein